ncbi:MAG: GNAT family N-acetyltransferase, partial [Rubricella sp.]
MTAPVIETKRLTLRPLRMSDAGLLALYAGDERVARMTTRIPHPYPPGAAEAFIERHLESAAALDTVWVMDGTKSDASELIGLISTNRDRDFGEEVGYWVGPAFWGAGYAQEALAAIIAN